MVNLNTHALKIPSALFPFLFLQTKFYSLRLYLNFLSYGKKNRRNKNFSRVDNGNFNRTFCHSFFSF